MTGAAACLAGFNGITVVIHGSSGCYYYPATLLRTTLSGTFLLEQEVIFGSEERLREVIDKVSHTGTKVAVVTTCVPAATGEDIRAMLSDMDVIVVDSPGFTGQFETGYKKALSLLSPRIDPAVVGVNIDGISLFDPYHAGNTLELTRMLALAGVDPGTIICFDKYSQIQHASPFTITADGDLASGIGRSLGGTLGFGALRGTFNRISDCIETAEADPVLAEIDRAEERVVAACDKYLRRFDPPVTAIFAGWSYGSFAAGALEKYLDAKISVIGCRNEIAGSVPWPATTVSDLSGVEGLLHIHRPDLILGSSFERSVRGDAAFVSLTPPVRGKVRLFSRPLAGTGGMLLFIEDVLNACMDRQSLGQ
jgi:nitrogenase molybdenum-iron protein alpha/beta subunit